MPCNCSDESSQKKSKSDVVVQNTHTVFPNTVPMSPYDKNNKSRVRVFGRPIEKNAETE